MAIKKIPYLLSQEWMDGLEIGLGDKRMSHDMRDGDETQSCTSERKNTVLITYSNIIMQKKMGSGHVRSTCSLT